MYIYLRMYTYYIYSSIQATVTCYFTYLNQTQTESTGTHSILRMSEKKMEAN